MIKTVSPSSKNLESPNAKYQNSVGLSTPSLFKIHGEYFIPRIHFE